MRRETKLEFTDKEGKKKEFYICELELLRTPEIIEILSTSVQDLKSIWDLRNLIPKVAPFFTKGVSIEELNSFGTSGLKECWKKLEEVNEDFLLILDSLGIKSALMEVLNGFIAGLKNEIRGYVVLAKIVERGIPSTGTGEEKIIQEEMEEAAEVPVEIPKQILTLITQE